MGKVSVNVHSVLSHALLSLPTCQSWMCAVQSCTRGCTTQCLLGRTKRSPSLLGGAKTGSLVRRGCAIVFGTSQLCNNFWYVAVAQYFTLHGTFTALDNSLGVVACLRNRLPSLVGK